jgi:hypothetical protein
MQSRTTRKLSGGVGRDDGVSAGAGREEKAGADVLNGEIREVGDDLRLARPARQHLQHIAYPHPGAGHRRAPAANGGIGGDAGVVGQDHGLAIA